ncbi:HU family DNA-binding protein [Spirosoma arcticum]
MTKQDLIRRISKQTELDDDLSRSIVETYFEVVKRVVSEGETVYIRTFGSFGPKLRARKPARNITQRTPHIIEAHVIPYFKPSPEFSRQVRTRKIPTGTP